MIYKIANNHSLSVHVNLVNPVHFLFQLADRIGPS
jgi:hypothetical protein